MNRIVLVFAMVLTLLSSPVWIHADQTETVEQQTLETALLWIAIIDQELYSESWDQTSQKFKDAMDQQEWVEKLEMFRKPLGEIQSREELDRGFFESIPNHPGLSMMVIQFKSSFEHKEQAVETVSVVRENDGPWQAAGYFIADSIDLKVQ